MQLEHEARSGGASSAQDGECEDAALVSWRAAARRRRDLSTAGELAVISERRADVLILSLSGELDLATSALLERELDSRAAARPVRLIVDLTGLEVIDSSGVQALMRAHERASDNGQQLSLRHRPRPFRQLYALPNTGARQ